MRISVQRALTQALAAVFILLAPAAHAAKGFAPAKFAAISIDATTGEVLFARNPDARRYPASLTKVMTLYLAFDALKAGRIHMSDRIVISRHAAAQPPSKLGLRRGASIRVRDALNVIVVKSANDLAVALAEKIAGSETRFVAQMNAKAQALGMRDTHFANASGLPNRRNYTTARDQAILGQAMVQEHPVRYALFDQSSTQFRGRTIPGHNRLVARPDIDGMKTGYIRASGFNLLTSGVREGHRVIAVVLGGSTAAIRDRYMARLIHASFVAETQASAERPLLVSLLLSKEPPVSERPPAAPQTLTVSENAAKPAGAAAEPAMEEARSPASPWRVQVGAFSTAEAGSARLEDILRRHPNLFEADDRRVKVAADGLYRARFVAGSQREAQKACEVLAREGDDCLPFKHVD